MNLFRKTLTYFETEKWKKILSFIVLGTFIVFLFCAISSYANWFHGSTKYFVFNSTSGIIIRAFISLLMCFSGFLVYLTYRKSISLKWLFLFIVLILISIFMSIVTPKTYYTLFTQNILYPFLSSAEVKITAFSIILDLFSFIVDVLFGFMFMFIFPRCFTKKMYLTILTLFLLIMLYSYLYSFVKEKDYYLKFLKGDWSYQNDTIGSIFGDKQQWGEFLAIVIPTVFICCYLVSKIKFRPIFKYCFYAFLLLVSLLTMVCTLVSFCKTAIICLLLFLFCFFAVFIIMNFINKKRIILSVVLLVVLFSIIGFSIYLANSKNIPENSILGFAKKLLDSLILRGGQSADSRASLVITVFQNFPSINMFLGMPKGMMDSIIRGILPELPNGMHTGFAILLARTGIFGFCSYLILLLFVILGVSKIFKYNKFLCISIIGGLVCSLILNLSEFEILILSSSMTVFISNVICVMLPMSFYTNKEELILNETNI